VKVLFKKWLYMRSDYLRLANLVQTDSQGRAFTKCLSLSLPTFTFRHYLLHKQTTTLLIYFVLRKFEEMFSYIFCFLLIR